MKCLTITESLTPLKVINAGWHRAGICAPAVELKLGAEIQI